jgi:hypothetical protein
MPADQFTFDHLVEQVRCANRDMSHFYSTYEHESALYQTVRPAGSTQTFTVRAQFGRTVVLAPHDGDRHPPYLSFKGLLAGTRFVSRRFTSQFRNNRLPIEQRLSSMHRYPTEVKVSDDLAAANRRCQRNWLLQQRSLRAVQVSRWQGHRGRGRSGTA